MGRCPAGGSVPKASCPCCTGPLRGCSLMLSGAGCLLLPGASAGWQLGLWPCLRGCAPCLLPACARWVHGQTRVDLCCSRRCPAQGREHLHPKWADLSLHFPALLTWESASKQLGGRKKSPAGLGACRPGRKEQPWCGRAMLREGEVLLPGLGAAFGPPAFSAAFFGGVKELLVYRHRVLPSQELLHLLYLFPGISSTLCTAIFAWVYCDF